MNIGLIVKEWRIYGTLLVMLHQVDQTLFLIKAHALEMPKLTVILEVYLSLFVYSA